MWKHAKSAGLISRPDYEYGSELEEFQNQTMNVEAQEECRKNVKTRI